MKIIVSDTSEIEEILHDCIVKFDDIRFAEPIGHVFIPVQVITNDDVLVDSESIVQRLLGSFRNKTTSGILKVVGATGIELLSDDGLGVFMINRIEKNEQSLVISGGFPGKLCVYGKEIATFLEYEVMEK